jgi:transposase
MCRSRPVTEIDYSHRFASALEGGLTAPLTVVHIVLRKQFKLLHKMVLQAVRSHDVCRRLMTIPGVGALTAATYLSTIDDPTRFT